MINIIVNRTITIHTTPAMIGIITGLSSLVSLITIIDHHTVIMTF